MDQKTIHQICREVYRQFPEVNGVSPVLKNHAAGKTLLIFQGEASTQGGKVLKRVVRVVADDQGNIVKMTTSR